MVAGVALAVGIGPAGRVERGDATPGVGGALVAVSGLGGPIAAVAAGRLAAGEAEREGDGEEDGDGGGEASLALGARVGAAAAAEGGTTETVRALAAAGTPLAARRAAMGPKTTTAMKTEAASAMKGPARTDERRGLAAGATSAASGVPFVVATGSSLCAGGAAPPAPGIADRAALAKISETAISSVSFCGALRMTRSRTERVGAERSTRAGAPSCWRSIRTGRRLFATLAGAPLSSAGSSGCSVVAVASDLVASRKVLAAGGASMPSSMPVPVAYAS